MRGASGRSPGWAGAALGVACLALSCAPGPSGPEAPAPTPTASSPGPVTSVTPPGPVAAPLPDELDAAGQAWVEQTLASLSLEEEAGQLVIPWISGGYAATSSEEFMELAEWVERDGLGGVVISIGVPHTYAAKLNALQRRARIPLLVTADFENGGPGMRINHSYALPSLLPQGGGTSFPPTMAFGATGDARLAYEYGRVTATEARAVGVHLLFAPVLDVNSNPLNPIINTRSFGEDPREVGRLGAAFIAGAHAGGAMTTAKHFPGHGDTGTDSHVALPIVTANRERLDTLELVPFRRGIEAGVDAVMTAHVAAPAVLGEEAPPATFSPYFLTELLRQEMGFKGLVFTDALRMGAITNQYGGDEASVLAIEAGSDVILAPESVPGSIQAVVDAVRSGRLSRERVQASVRRILEAKARLGLHRTRLVAFDDVGDVVGSAEHMEGADRVAARSVTLVRDRDQRVPIDPAAVGSVLSITYARETALVAGRTLDAELRLRIPGVRSVRLTDPAPSGLYDSLGVWSREADLILVNAFVPPQAGSGSVGAPAELARFVQEVGAAKPTVVLSFGNPYLLAAFPDVGSYLIAWGDREVSERAAAAALLGEADITGRLPISLPPFHGRGEGLDRSAVRAAPATAVRGAPLALAGILPERGGAQGTEADRDRDGQEVDRGRRSPLEIDPATVDMSEEVLARLDSTIFAAIDDQATPGAALAVGRHGRLVRLRGYGRLDWNPDSGAVDASSIYDLASLTKVVGTTTAAMMLHQEGRLDLDAPVVSYLPWWSGGQADKATVTVRQLLLHRAGLPPFRRFYLDRRGREQYREAIAALPLDYAPGESTVYSDIGLMSVAFVIEAIADQPLDQVLQERVWRPLAMIDTGFRPDTLLFFRVAPTEVDTTFRDGLVRARVHDENAYAIGGVAGHAGLFSSARDLAVMASLLMADGVAEACVPEPGSGIPCSGVRPEPVRLLDAEVLRDFLRRYDETASRAMGWDTPSGASSAGDYFSANSIGHTGFTGTSIWMDPELDLFVVLLTNRVNPTRNNQKHVPLRRAVHDLAALAVTDRTVTLREGAR